MKMILALVLCLALTGCVYSSANLISIQSDNTTVFGGWGYIHCGTGSRIVMYRSQQSCNLVKKDMPSWPSIPTITTDPENVNIGKPNTKMPKDRIATPSPQEQDTSSIVETAATVITK